VLGDWCACGPRGGTPTVIDLDDDAFRRLANLSAGVIAVTVRTIPAPPPTATEP
jgi:expansin (peptidoglycan-binding protein)